MEAGLEVVLDGDGGGAHFVGWPVFEEGGDSLLGLVFS